MLRLLIITDFTESFARKLLKGIVDYSRTKEQWVICRMPPAYKAQIGIPGVVRFAKDWGADAVIGQFEETDDVGLFAKNGIAAVAQDFKKRFTSIPNITADYIGTGRMAARFYIDRGFRNFGFFGFNHVCWSDERLEGFRREVEEAGFGSSFYPYNLQDIDHLWYYERDKMAEWLRMIPKPIGIMACDDNQGNNLIEACHSAGRMEDRGAHRAYGLLPRSPGRGRGPEPCQDSRTHVHRRLRHGRRPDPEGGPVHTQELPEEDLGQGRDRRGRAVPQAPRTEVQERDGTDHLPVYH